MVCDSRAISILLLGKALNDITLLYYTSNTAPERFLANIRGHLIEGPGKDLPIISVSQKPIDFGTNICVGEIGQSIYNIYKQILIGAKVAITPWIACCEDDSLYNLEHFSYRPKDIFAYNINRLNIHKDIFFYRRRAGFCMCIAPTELLIKTLETRFQKYPERSDSSHLLRENLVGFGEPGRSEAKLGLPPVPLEIFTTKIPTMTFSHRYGVGGVRKIMARDIVTAEDPYWGKAIDLWNHMYD